MTDELPPRPGWRPWHRALLAAGVAVISTIAVATMAAVTSTGASSGQRSPVFEPDLSPRPVGTIKLCRESRRVVRPDQACTSHGTGRIRTVLRISSQVADKGRGPLEFAPKPGDSGDCNNNGDGGDDIRVNQILYVDDDGDNVFERGGDTERRSRPAGCRYFHAAHNHFHLAGYAKYELRRERTGKLARKGKKVSFCISDTESFAPGLPGAPSNVHYDISDCREGNSVSGTSVGWYDEYPWRLSGQQIDVTGIKPGKYCLITEVDPGRNIRERRQGNNVRKARIKLNPRAASSPGQDPRDIVPLPGRCRLGR